VPAGRLPSRAGGRHTGWHRRAILVPSALTPATAPRHARAGLLARLSLCDAVTVTSCRVRPRSASRSMSFR
jgi:hypothetical protein